MLNISLSAISYIYQANDVFIRNEQDVKRMEERVYYQRKAMTQLKLLGFLSHIACEQQCILPKQFYEDIENDLLIMQYVRRLDQCRLKKNQTNGAEIRLSMLEIDLGSGEHPPLTIITVAEY